MDWIEKLAREHGTGGWQTLEDVVRFGRSVAAAEREACAKVCEEADCEVDNFGREDAGKTLRSAAANIRERYNQQ